LRAGPIPTASAPLDWAEVESGAVRPFRSDEVLLRIDEYGDLMADLCGGGPRVPA
jgi:DNA primase